MAQIAALLPDRGDRESLQAASPPHTVHWARNWTDLRELVRARPIAAVVADLNSEPRKDGVLRVFRHRERYPRTPIVVWTEGTARELYRLGKAGAADVVLPRDARDPVFVAELLDTTLARGVAHRIAIRLRDRLEPGALSTVRRALEGAAQGLQVPDLARDVGVSASTLERRFARWGLPTPGRFLMWMRVLHGLHWLSEPGRSTESVARLLGYSSGPAFRRAVQAAMGERAAGLRESGTLDRALERLLEECPGAGTASSPASGGG